MHTSGHNEANRSSEQRVTKYNTSLSDQYPKVSRDMWWKCYHFLKKEKKHRNLNDVSRSDSTWNVYLRNLNLTFQDHLTICWRCDSAFSHFLRPNLVAMDDSLPCNLLRLATSPLTHSVCNSPLSLPLQLRPRLCRPLWRLSPGLKRGTNVVWSCFISQSYKTSHRAIVQIIAQNKNTNIRFNFQVIWVFFFCVHS